MESLATNASRLGQSLLSLRQRAGLSIGALARVTGLSKTSISNIEAGKANPSIETMWRLADALGVTIGTLVGDDSESASHILRRDDVPDFVSASGLHARILSVARSEHRTELLELIFDEALAHTSNAHTAGTEELLICIEGAIEAGPDGDLTLVRRPHQYVATEPSRGILMMVYPATLTPILGRSPNGSIAQSSFWEPLPVTRARSK